MRRYLAIVLMLLSCLPALADEAADRAFLLRGVRVIAAPGLPGPLCVFGPKAFPVVGGRISTGVAAAVVAASTQAAGRVVALGHPAYLDREALDDHDTAALLVNAVRWCAPRAAAPRVGVPGHPGLRQVLTRNGLRVVALDGPWTDRLRDLDVVCVYPASLRADEVSALQAFVSRGGGLVAADLGWGWLQLHPGLTLAADHPGNRLLAAAGLAWSDGWFARTAAHGYAAPGDIAGPLDAQAALALIEGRALPPGAATQASWTLTQAAATVGDDDPLLRPRLDRARLAAGPLPVPTEAAPLTLARDARARVILALETERARRLPPHDVKANPAARAFPGVVPAGAQRGAATVEIDLGEAGWHGTGRYAAPGEVITVSLPADAAARGLRARIGAHTDVLWDLDAWRRAPEISMSEPLRQPRTELASAFGGLVYIEVPSGLRGAVEVSVEGAVGAPRFALGHTRDWAQARLQPGPWAELEGRRVILTVPSDVVRKLDDPTPLMQLWDSVADACADLAARPHERERRERIVTDVQISSGYMHAGYPIMAHLDAAPVAVDLALLKREGSWGLFHELGHNHQSAAWTFEGTGEVTCNLFTRYVLDTVCGLPPARQPNSGAPKLRPYLARGAPFEAWRREPFLALLMYDQLQQAFGWAPFQRVFAAYRALPREQQPKSDADKRDLWMVSMSRAVGRDLGPFFQAWGVPTSPAARASVAGLPPWLPPAMRSR